VGKSPLSLDNQQVSAKCLRAVEVNNYLHQGLKHISVVVCISAGGDHMTPFVISSQVNDRVISTLKSEGFRIGSDMILRKLDKPYMNAALFTEYVLTVFLPHIAKIRHDLRFTDQEAVLLMNNGSLHLREDILHLKSYYPA
jgi:hypothetical protein